MIGSEYSFDNHKTLKIGIWRIIKNMELLKVVPDNPNTKKLCKNTFRTFHL